MAPKSNKLLIIIVIGALVVTSLFIIFFSFSSSSSSSLHHSDDDDIKNRHDDSSSSTVKTNVQVKTDDNNGHDETHHNKHRDNNKFLLDFLLREKLLITNERQQLFACYNLQSSIINYQKKKPTKYETSKSRDTACEDYLSKSVSLLDHHAEQSRKGKGVVVVAGDSTKKYKNDDQEDSRHHLIEALYKEGSKGAIAFSSTSKHQSSSSPSKSLLNEEKFYSHSKKMKSQAKMDFINNNNRQNGQNKKKFDSYEDALEKALVKISMRKRQNEDDMRSKNKHVVVGNSRSHIFIDDEVEKMMADERFDSDFSFSNQKKINRDSKQQSMGNKHKKNKKKKEKGTTNDDDNIGPNADDLTYHLEQFNLIFKLPSSSSSSGSSSSSNSIVAADPKIVESIKVFFDENEEFFHKLISLFIREEEDEENGIVSSSSSSSPQPGAAFLNFIFVGLDDQTLIKEILKIFVQDKKHKEHCIITSSSNSKKLSSQNEDIVAVSCNKDHSSGSENDEEGNSGEERNSNKNKNKNRNKSNRKGVAATSSISSSAAMIHPSYFCSSGGSKKIELKSGLKFGTKTGVYTGRIGGSSLLKAHAVVATSSSSLSSPSSVIPVELVKHYNFVQYVHGFSSGLHDFLSSSFSFRHPVIVMPSHACVLVSTGGGSNNNNNNNNEQQVANKAPGEDPNSLKVTESILQFQPFIKNQMSLTKFMAQQKKLLAKMKSSSSSSALLTWRDRVDLVLQLLCTFDFLHSHPQGPFSFDDNHPDQYLIVSNKNDRNENNNHKLRHHHQHYASKSKYLLKMVDIDTLQKAKLKRASSSSAGKKINPQRTVNQDMKFFENNNNNDNNEQHVKTTNDMFSLRCRCFYCKGRSNCLFVNSFEGYQACGQYKSAKDHGDEGNREVPRSDDDNQEEKENDDDTRNTNDDEKNQKEEANNKLHHLHQKDDGHRQCTLLTDSWYLGQIMFYLIHGDLLFPSSWSMKQVIDSIEDSVLRKANKKGKKSTKSKGSESLQEIFPHLLGTLQHYHHQQESRDDNNNDEDDNTKKIHAKYMDVVKKLLIDRISPREAAMELLSSMDKDSSSNTMSASSSFTKSDWCPMDYTSKSVGDEEEGQEGNDFEGLRVAV